ncbi:hypothetical protein C900_01468 [Fulvivirga imtechensis AK7]|uniref:Lipocalin-like domain-containing protein n=1 Tax=Fulvivirga imtechensis AK7 TaxID=1237149 RepID=L8JW94_9BACT|nr:hypothetical protein [Fulvivirga imtechensis]ELR72473.1 hypothetical protein C900_01468 [Fulvivirga imtechensis AK7]
MLRFLFCISFVIVLGCADDDSFENEPYTGEWRLEEIFLDGVQQPEWPYAVLNIDQLSAEGGVYNMPKTVYDSIWPEEGHWSKSRYKNHLLIDGDAVGEYDSERNVLWVSKIIPGTGVDECTDTICLPIVTGEWLFGFTRK